MEDLVGICYTTWFNPILDGNGKNDPPNITEILEGKRKWGVDSANHYWAESALGSQWMKQYITAYKAHEECPKLYEGAE